MIRFFTLSLALTLSASLFAQLNGDGYYRLLNKGTERYAYITDNTGSIDLGTTSADLNAIQLWKTFDRAASDPASVIYIKNTGEGLDIQGQGAALYAMLGHYLQCLDLKNGTYYAYASNSGLTKYLYDGYNSEILVGKEKGYLSTNSSGIDNKYRTWYIKPLTTDNTNYFGIKPELSVGSYYYGSIYASFPFALQSSGMEAYYISAVDSKLGVAVMEPIAASTVIAGGSPVIVRCSSASPVNNKLTIGGTATSAIASKNKLKGVYFCNTDMQTHYNYTDYDAKTMRVLGTTADGSLGFVTYTTTTTLPTIPADKQQTRVLLPANKAYLPVGTDAPAELKIVTPEEYAQLVVSGINSVKENRVQGPFDVYNILGVKVRSQVTTLQGIPAGIYLVNGKKICIR